MYYYKFKNNILTSFQKYNFTPAEEHECVEKGKIFFLGKLPLGKSRRSFIVTSQDELFLQNENIEILNLLPIENKLPEFLLYKIAQRKVVFINTNYANWDELLTYNPRFKRINIIGLGDVGGILLTGLRLLGADVIDSIGIYDKNEDKVNRWYFENNQIVKPFSQEKYPKVIKLREDEIFNCDILIFCVSVGVPDINEKRDVRMLQFEGNSKIIAGIAKKARKNNFKGILAVVSDPVDLLCKVAYLESNKDEYGNLDYKGLYPEQIVGFGLGVMNARAIFYSKEIAGAEAYEFEGRVFGPHGQGIVVANSIKNYDDEVSLKLTQKVRMANIDVRNTGFKPYVAPALSSGALSILSMLSGDWFYASTFIGGVYFGCKLRLINGIIEIERNQLNQKLLERIKKSYHDLDVIL